MGYLVENYFENNSLFSPLIWTEKTIIFIVQLVHVNLFIQNLTPNLMLRIQRLPKFGSQFNSFT